ncbi:MAG: phosphatidylserine decarboxylase [Methylococcales bacterium]|jgi:phosphatidylserine decarboxylase|nr:phosphatidylserine decarboxylase [Methylococcales bacterium]MBT7445858.1 phosphatidylserine decarboxylase [Methylococcales bacterium]
MDTFARIKIAIIGVLQYILPHQALSRIVYFLTRIQSVGFKNTAIRWFMGSFGVSLHNAIKENPEDYKHFNDFFTRALKPEARPIAKGEHTIVSPVDGAVSQFGDIVDGQLIQAKGSHFSLNALLGDNLSRSKKFTDGQFITIYLAPKDYHRIHMPLAGKLTDMCHIPGRLFSVNDISTKAIPELFARNERAASVFDTEVGPVAVVMVGALFVSSMDTVWHGQINPPKGLWITERQYEAGQHSLEKADELGRFNMGSTVILCFPKDSIEWDEAIKPGHILRMGQALAYQKQDD